MNNRISYIIFGVAIIAGSLILWSNIARISPHSGSDKTVNVSGQGESFATPDIYTFSVRAQATWSTTKDVNRKLAEMISKARDIIKSANIDDKDIQSQNVNVYENRVYENSSSRRDGYQWNHSLRIKARQIEEVWPLLDRLAEVDGLLVDQWSYSLDDNSEALQQARKDAFDKAQAKASELADLAGMKLGKAISIDESISGWRDFGRIYGMGMAMQESADWLQSNIDPGQDKYTVDLYLVFELK